MLEIKIREENHTVKTVEGDFVLANVYRGASRSVLGIGELSANTLFALAEELQPSEVAETLGGGRMGAMYKEMFDFFSTTRVSTIKNVIEEEA